ncbi:hypothetical protein WJX77_004334 [Trebouxia sp. C0004]
MRISHTNFRPLIVVGAPENKASQEHPAGSSASARVPGARQDICQERTPSTEAQARVPEVQGSNVVNSESLDGTASRSLAISEHEEIQDRGEATSKLMDERSIYLLPAQPEGIKHKRTQ